MSRLSGCLDNDDDDDDDDAEGPSATIVIVRRRAGRCRAAPRTKPAGKAGTGGGGLESLLRRTAAGVGGGVPGRVGAPDRCALCRDARGSEVAVDGGVSDRRG